MVTYETLLTDVGRITKKYYPKLEKLGLHTVQDLLFHLPVRYEDFSAHTPIDELIAGDKATIVATIDDAKMNRIPNRRLTITSATLVDDTGSITATWWNQPYVIDQLGIGTQVRISGTVKNGKKGLELSSPVHERIDRTPTNTGRLVPIYPETAGLSSRWIRWQITELFDKLPPIEEILPSAVLTELDLPHRDKALAHVHFPDDHDSAARAQHRFVCEELFIMQCATLVIKASHQQHKAPTIPFDKNLTKDFVSNLPFTLTDAQRKAAYQILTDCAKDRPMNRLLNGDVGAGKTIVAALAMLGCATHGTQVALLAPTEVLARQHFHTIIKLLEEHEIACALFTRSYKSDGNHRALIADRSRAELLKKIKTGDVSVVIGTHALIQDDVHFHNLALVIIDEQHRFGVAQRAALQQKSFSIDDGSDVTVPHFLTMTATPIPRTLSLVLFGDLDVSLLDEMPRERLPIKTTLSTDATRSDVYAHVKKEIAAGRQAYVILPLVEESSAIAQTKAAISEHTRLQEKIFPTLRVGLVHGRMKAKEKEDVMQRFSDGAIEILVATAVVEVGIDVPNASVMIIENAERFGLSQLHQFRGRIGRGTAQSYCYVFYGGDAHSHSTGHSVHSPSVQPASKRLQTFAKHADGFTIAEEDLKLRGPGQFFGTQQSGLPDSVMKSAAHLPLLSTIRECAKNTLVCDPGLKKNPLLAQTIHAFIRHTHLE